MDFVKQLDLSQLPRCGQQWEQMQSVEGGRLCGQCDRVIVDFRDKSPGEIAELMLCADQPMCGVYRPEQLAALERHSTTERRSGIPPLLAATVALLSMQSLQAGPLVKSDPLVQMESTVKAVVQADTLGTDSIAQVARVIRGRVFDPDTGEDIPFVVTRVVGRELGGDTDFDGKFTINLSELNDSITHVDLECRHIGYQNVVLHQVAINTDKLIDSPLAQGVSGLVAFSITVSEPPKPTLWQRIILPFRRNQ